MAPARKQTQTTASVDPAELVVAIDSYATEVDGVDEVVQRGRILRKSDPRVRSEHVRPCTDVDLIETATAAPGEHRSVSW